MFSIPIYLKEKEYKVIFSTEEERKEYVAKEALFCRNATMDRYAALSSEDRTLMLHKLNERRYAFAIAHGYKPNKKLELVRK
jgi:hypothetical protein